MALKRVWLVVDTETTQNGNCADFGAAIIDRKGNVLHQIGVVVANFQNEELFNGGHTGFFAKKNLEKRQQEYSDMLKSGERTLASVGHVNHWLEKAALAYGDRLTLTAYNLPFDVRVCEQSGIDLAQFLNRFCLWEAACKYIATRKGYKKYCLKHHRECISEKHNFRTNAEIMTNYILDRDPSKNYEPHTALEDVLEWENVILLAVLRCKKPLTGLKAYNWREYTLKNQLELMGVKL